MFCSTEQATDLLNAQFNTGARFGNIMLRGIEQWVELNLHLTKQQFDNNLSTINQLADVQHQASSVAEQRITAANEAINYPITVYEIMIKAQTELAKLIGQHFEELNQQAIKIFNTVQPEINTSQIVVNGSGENRVKAAPIKTANTSHRKNEARITGH